MVVYFDSTYVTRVNLEQFESANLEKSLTCLLKSAPSNLLRLIHFRAYLIRFRMPEIVQEVSNFVTGQNAVYYRRP
jgi:hypothetical protein